MPDLRTLMNAVKNGELEIDEAIEQVRAGLFEDLGHSRVDHDRLDRHGTAEVVFGQGKSVAQLTDIVGSIRSVGHDVLVSRIQPEKARRLLPEFPDAVYHEQARLLAIQPEPPEKTETRVCVVCAGTSDLPVAEEARLTAGFYGNSVDTVYDAGVAGLHRLVADLGTLRRARVIVAVAGMEGALPSVVAGLVKAPVIAVPTSVGYGANFGGVSALLAMLNSCASGLSVVNIDNGFGAGYLANLINRL